MRTERERAKVNEWSAEFTLAFDPARVAPEDIFGLLTLAGQTVGLGDFRPQHGGPFGQFTVRSFQLLD